MYFILCKLENISNERWPDSDPEDEETLASKREIYEYVQRNSQKLFKEQQDDRRAQWAHEEEIGRLRSTETKERQQYREHQQKKIDIIKKIKSNRK
jgi:hypothetical protein